ncbi:Uncharacterized membrane protein YcaP, DUF421 family [Marinococcus luteus]|uniref:Uncharacterized membrane protein YcaP, DUF421 family n=1 Tax=Marinococcus luteus TaxID=1122204 RepID=A0A1H2RJ95_9BACI|nr:DUF421 domain-containing protein [Marinococcus luteus]SDW19501.1 Uncharacterized membrane protein YcaP, DUF421 family [Marinococcus luteus]
MFMSIIISIGIGLIGIIVITRLLGKKQLAQVTPLDFVYVLVLGGIVEQGLYNTDIQWFHMVFTFVLWGFVIYVLETLTQKYDGFRWFIKGANTVLMQDGQVYHHNLKKNKLELEQLRMLLRTQGIFSFRDVEYATLETSGTLSVLEKAGAAPASMNDDPGAPVRNEPSFLLVENGAMHLSNLQASGWDAPRLKEELHHLGYQLTDLYFAEWTSQDGFFVQTKQQK